MIEQPEFLVFHDNGGRNVSNEEKAGFSVKILNLAKVFGNSVDCLN